MVIDLVGGVRWPELLDALAIGGRYVTSGAIAGPIVELDLRALYLKDQTLLGSTRQPPQVFGDFVGYIERGEVLPTVARVYDLANIRNAQTAFFEKSHVCKIALRIP